MSRPSAVERWRGLLRQHAESGMSVAEFCRQRDVSEASFYQWRKRLRAEPLAAACYGAVVVRSVSAAVGRRRSRRRG